MTLPLPHSSVIKVVYIPSTSRYGGCSTYTHLSTPKSIHPMPRQNFFFLFVFYPRTAHPEAGSRPAGQDPVVLAGDRTDPGQSAGSSRSSRGTNRSRPSRPAGSPNPEMPLPAVQIPSSGASFAGRKERRRTRERAFVENDTKEKKKKNLRWKCQVRV